MKPIVFAALYAVLAPNAAHAGVLQDHQGHWLGELRIPDGRVLKIGAEFLRRADGSYWASFSSPDQDAFDLPVATLKESADSVDLDISFATLKMTWDQDHFNGEYRQNGIPSTLTLRQVSQFPMRHRPQDPHGPFPYTDESLSIAGGDGVTLGATLSIPAGVARPNVVVLVHGSGPGNRDANVAGHRLFAVMADHLARHGVAVLRYDKRGVARSTGDYDGHTLPQLVDDLDAVVAALKARKQFGRLGLIGLSEGPAIAAAVAARRGGAVDFVVSLSGTGLGGLDMLLLQDRMWAEGRGAGAGEVPRLMRYVRSFYEIVIAETEVESRLAKLRALRQALSEEDRGLVEKYEMNQGTLSLDWARKAFLRASLLADPRKDWRAVRGPVLVLGGSLDRQVPAKENVHGIVAALRDGGNRQVESEIMASLNHALQTATTGAEEEYARIEETIAPKVLRRITTCVRK